MASKWTTVETEDGPMHAYLAEPDGGGPYPGIVVLQEAFGINSYMRSVCDRLADVGYVALAPELFHRKGTHVELPYDGDMQRVLEQMAALTDDGLEDDIDASVAALRAHGEVDPRRLAAVGFCLGGYAAMIAGLTTAIAAVVAFYPGLVVRKRPNLALSPILDRLPKLRAATLVNFGGADQGIPPEDVEAVRQALGHSGAQHRIEVWPGAQHGFHTHDRASYDPKTAEAAWHASLQWLDRMVRSNA
ncbi:MAG TPA: dienelactone hydrolase family protein [Kofleriaceae bacterium]|nr:dienelactone hydrolase family protein [Kofleriaceae bacterium]